MFRPKDSKGSHFNMSLFCNVNPYLLTVFLLLCGIHNLVQSEDVPLSVPNCIYNYTLRVDEIQAPVTLSTINNQCVRSSQDGFTSCQSLSGFLDSFNGKLAPSDCLLLFLEPGEYIITTQTTVMTYSIALSGTLDGGVTISCLESLFPSRPSNVTEDPNTSVLEYSVPLAFNKNGGEVIVFLEGITFQDCIRALEFDELQSVSIVNCTFRDFRGTAVDLFNVYYINIVDSVFSNCSTNITKAQYRGNSGAISIAYYSQGNSSLSTGLTGPIGKIRNCNFTNNKALHPHGQSRTQINQALNNNIYHGRGGGVGVIVIEALRNVTFTIEDCLFYYNIAESFGGGLYLNIAGEYATHNFTLINNNFTRNSCGTGSFGGGLQVGFLIRNLDRPPCTFTIVECYFQENVADYGGGMGIVQVYSQGAGNMVTLAECTFIRNNASIVGSAMMFTSFLYVQNRQESHYYVAKNNIFSSNSCPGGTVGLGFINLNFAGYNILQFNQGPGLRIVGAQVGIQKGSVSLIGNNVENQEGGAVFIQDFGQITLYPGSSMEFINNTGRIGSAIVVNVQVSSPVFSKLVFNPQCFLIHKNSSLAPGEWKDVSITFSGNRASVGPAVFISHLDHCAWYSADKVNNITNEINATFKIEEFPTWEVFKYTQNSNVAYSHRNNSMDQRFYFQTDPVKIIVNDNVSHLAVRPGEQRPLNIQGLDQFDNPTYIIVRLSDSRAAINAGAFSQAGISAFDNSTDPDIVRFEPSLLPIQPSDLTVDISYGFPALLPDQFHAAEVIRIVMDTPYNVRTSELFFLNMSFVYCQHGYELTNRQDGDRLVSCLCIRNDFNILNCEEDVIILRDGHWAGSERQEPLPHLHLTPCPASYCRCHFRGGRQTCETLFFQDDPTSNLQCHPLRDGTLCGHCINGTGAGVLRTNCRECDKENYFALGFLIVGDAVVVGLILFLAVKFQMTFPHALKGFLFYVQTAYYTTEHFPASFWDIRQYMLYLSSLLGFYFPWDFCLFPNMSVLVSITPKFTPASIATIISVVVLIGIYITRSRDGREHIWHGVWMLILLLYAPLVHTCVAILHCPFIPGSTEETYHWYLDGEVKCFKDTGHIVLSIGAVVVLFSLVLLIPTVFVFTVVASFKKIQSKYRTIGWIYNALTAGYRESWEARWWASFELLRRLLLIVVAVSLPGRSVANLFVVLNILTMHMFFKPYAKVWQNGIETVVLISYALLLLIRATPTFLNNISTYVGTEIPANRGAELAAIDNVTWLLFPFFYFPVVFGVICLVIGCFHRILKKIRDVRIRNSFKLRSQANRDSTVTSNFDNTNLDQGYYRPYEDEDIHSRNSKYTVTDFDIDELIRDRELEIN